GSRQFGLMPSSGSDFVTAPELSPLFGRAVARQVEQALLACDADPDPDPESRSIGATRVARADGQDRLEVWEFGAGSGALAAQLLEALGPTGSHLIGHYNIVDLSGSLRQRQQVTLAPWGDTVRWLDELPATMRGVVIGNEVLDAMPVQLLLWDGSDWFERGVALLGDPSADDVAFTWADRATDLRPPVDTPFVAGTTVEIQPQARAFIATLAERLVQGAAFFIDYGFPEAEFYHPQRLGGTLMCHRGHRADADPLVDVGDKDITAHVDFTGIAMAAQDGGLDVLGYTSQARFLINCGLVADLEGASPQVIGRAQMLLAEHEMGELFKVIGFARGCDASLLEGPLGFTAGDRTHTL
ncbi:MAG: methyltransferase type 12, partial [Rhizobacter sp.]|nr:methyltransferase type 12 [Rhizobacter sp.]